MWDLPGPGVEPVSPALADGFLTTAPPGKSPSVCFLKSILIWLSIPIVDRGTNIIFATTITAVMLIEDLSALQN